MTRRPDLTGGGPHAAIPQVPDPRPRNHRLP